MNQNKNLLSEMTFGDTHELVSSHDLIDEKSIRDFQVRNKFKQLRAICISTGLAIEIIREYYPYLQFDTIRKIVYHKS
jgi:hypothetical protein